MSATLVTLTAGGLSLLLLACVRLWRRVRRSTAHCWACGYPKPTQRACGECGAVHVAPQACPECGAGGRPGLVGLAGKDRVVWAVCFLFFALAASASQRPNEELTAPLPDWLMVRIAPAVEPPPPPPRGPAVQRPSGFIAAARRELVFSIVQRAYRRELSPASFKVYGARDGAFAAATQRADALLKSLVVNRVEAGNGVAGGSAGVLTLDELESVSADWGAVDLVVTLSYDDGPGETTVVRNPRWKRLESGVAASPLVLPVRDPASLRQVWLGWRLQCDDYAIEIGRRTLLRGGPAR